MIDFSFPRLYYRKSYSANSFIPRALLIANKIALSIDFFDSSHDKFKSNVLLMLKSIGHV